MIRCAEADRCVGDPACPVYAESEACQKRADTESTAAVLARVTQERDYLLGVVEGMRRTIAELIAERDEAKLGHRASRAERDKAWERIGELEALLEHAEQYARDLQDNGDVPPVPPHR